MQRETQQPGSKKGLAGVAGLVEQIVGKPRRSWLLDIKQSETQREVDGLFVKRSLAQRQDLINGKLLR